jgi:hypothetical protein
LQVDDILKYIFLKQDNIGKTIMQHEGREKEKITVLINVAVLFPGLTSGIEAP